MQGVQVSSLPLFSSPYLSSPSAHSSSLLHFSLLYLSPFPLFPIFSIPPPPYFPLTHTPFPISLPMPPSINIPYPKNSLSSPIFAFVISVDILEKIQLRANSFARFFFFFFAGEYNSWQAVSVWPTSIIDRSIIEGAKIPLFCRSDKLFRDSHETKKPVYKHD